MPSKTLLLILFSLLMAGGVGCAGRGGEGSGNPLAIRVAVLDFLPPDPDYHDPEFKTKTKAGWWFGQRDVYANPNIGLMAADALASRLNRAERLTVESRYDFRQYLTEKASLLRQQYPDLTDAQRRDLVLEALYENADEVGRELQVDRVITGRVLSERMTHNRTFHSWNSRFEIEVSMWDVGRGERVFQKTFDKSRRFASPDLALEAFADDFAKWFGRQFGYR